jgi:hypothetical protein
VRPPRLERGPPGLEGSIPVTEVANCQQVAARPYRDSSGSRCFARGCSDSSGAVLPPESRAQPHSTGTDDAVHVRSRLDGAVPRRPANRVCRIERDRAAAVGAAIRSGGLETTARHRRRGLSVLGAGRPSDRVLRGRQGEADRSVGRQREGYGRTMRHNGRDPLRRPRNGTLRGCPRTVYAGRREADAVIASLPACALRACAGCSSLYVPSNRPAIQTLYLAAASLGSMRP